MSVCTAPCYTCATYAMALCLRLSQVGVLLKWLNTGSQSQKHHTIAQESSFLVRKISAKFRRGHLVRTVVSQNLIRSLSPYSHTYCHSYYYWYSITHSLSHSMLKSFLFCKSSLPQPFLFSPSGFTIWISHTVYCYLWAYPSFYFLVFLFLHIFSCRFRAVD